MVAVFRKHLTGQTDDNNSSSSQVVANSENQILTEFCEESPILKRLLIKAPTAEKPAADTEPAATDVVKTDS